MKAEIEQLVASDEAARIDVENAKKEADRLVQKAKAEAKAIMDSAHERLAKVEKAEIKPILVEAKRQADERIRQADDYVRRLRSGIALKKGRILDEFLKAVLEGTGASRQRRISTHEFP